LRNCFPHYSKLFLAGTALAICTNPAIAQLQSIEACSLSGFTDSPTLSASQSSAGLQIEWSGNDEQRLRLQFAIADGAPTIHSLALSANGSQWTTLLQDAGIEYRVVEGFRRISNQQLAPLRDLGVELTQEIIDRYKWDVFWDAPLDLREEMAGGNPPPAAGVANQPGLPRSADEIRRNTISYQLTDCRVTRDGTRGQIHFEGVNLGSFRGELVFTVYAGSNLIRTEVIAATSLPSVAYKYDAGITGISLNDASAVVWRDTGDKLQSYQLAGPVNDNPVALTAANRLVVAETGAASLAAFPPPHTFFWAREVEINAGYNWYRKDSDSTFSIGIRQGEQEVVERYLANWSLYSAPPGSSQHMAAYFLPALGDSEVALAESLRFTRGDVYKALPGYKVMGSHYHTNMGRELLDSGSLDTRLRDFEVLRAAGINIAGPVDRPQDATQLEELHWLFEGATRHSDSEFMVLPEMENSNLLGGHWDLLFSHPVYYVDSRPAGTPLVTQHPQYGKMYNIGNVDDVMAMVAAEDMLIFMPHPRTKGSTGYPDAVADSPQFLNDSYRGVGWRWGMGSDLSERRLSDYPERCVGSMRMLVLLNRLDSDW